MSRADAGQAAVSAIPSIPRDAEGPVFPTPWAARAFAMAVALNERGLFAWRDWSEQLGEELRREPDPAGTDPENYWRAWLRTLEAMLASADVATSEDLLRIKEAWREAAEHTPHGQPIELPRR